MTTVIVNSPVKATQKPARSLTHPLCEQKNGSIQPRKKPSEHIDPDELRQRLEAHLTQQQRQAKVRRAKVIAKEKESAYHHIPKVAAAAFQRTATPGPIGEKETKKSIHKLGYIAIKHHTEESIYSPTSPFNLQQTLAIDHARKQRDLIGERNQFQRTRHLEDAARLDKERNVNKVPRRSFGTEHLELPPKTPYSRPFSTGDLDWDGDPDTSDPLFDNQPTTKVPMIHQFIDRQDWEQRDEVPAEVERSVKERVGPLLRKTNSIWILRNKKDTKADAAIEADSSPQISEIKPRKTFLGMFRR